MDDLKEYMNKKIKEILRDSGYPRDQIEEAALSMGYALGSLSDDDYFAAMAGAFSGTGDMTAVDEFLSATYTLPDTQ
jgi:hypothetical protein